MKFILQINTDNSAFSNGLLGIELSRILGETGCILQQLSVTDAQFTSDAYFTLHDLNGNTVGFAAHQEEWECPYK